LEDDLSSFPLFVRNGLAEKTNAASRLNFFFSVEFRIFCVVFFGLPVYLSVSGWALCILDFYHHGSWVNWAL